MFYALFDKEKSYKELFEDPSNYEPGLKSQYFSTKIFWMWILEAAL
jgi:hypothetical protein